jgi:hypothetical protein
MPSIGEVKLRIAEERAKVTTSINAVLGSRWLLAVLAAFAISFASHTIFFPERLPPVAGITIANLGLPTTDFGLVGDQATQAYEAAQRQDVSGRLGELLAERPQLAATLNIAGLVISLLLLVWNIHLASRRYAHGVALFIPKKRRPS